LPLEGDGKVGKHKLYDVPHDIKCCECESELYLAELPCPNCEARPALILKTEPVANLQCSDGVIKQLFDKEVNKMEKEIEEWASRGSYNKAAELTDRLIGINQIYRKLNLEGIAL